MTNTFAAFASASDKGFANPEEFEMRVEVFKENLQQLQDLNANASDFLVRLGRLSGEGSSHWMPSLLFVLTSGTLLGWRERVHRPEGGGTQRHERHPQALRRAKVPRGLFSVQLWAGSGHGSCE